MGVIQKFRRPAAIAAALTIMGCLAAPAWSADYGFFLKLTETDLGTPDGLLGDVTGTFSADDSIGANVGVIEVDDLTAFSLSFDGFQGSSPYSIVPIDIVANIVDFSWTIGSQYVTSMNASGTVNIANNEGFQLTITSGLTTPSQLDHYFANLLDPNEMVFNTSYSDFAAEVPEPSTYALMIAGMGTLVASARRRRARSTAN